MANEVDFYRGSSTGFKKLNLKDYSSGGTFFYTEDDNQLYLVDKEGEYVCLSNSGGANITNYTATISGDWTGSATTGFSKSVTVSGISADDEPIVDVILEGSATENKTALQNWAKVSHIECGTNKITLYSYASSSPAGSFKIKLKVVK